MTIETQDETLCRLLYTSRLAAGESEDSATTVPAAIAEHATRRNAASGITGILLFVDGQFIQILEGPAPEVEATFERICQDFRHEDLKLIDLINVDERIFPEWHMAFLGTDSETRIALLSELEEIKFLVGVNARQAVEQMRNLLDEQLEAA